MLWSQAWLCSDPSATLPQPPEPLAPCRCPGWVQSTQRLVTSSGRVLCSVTQSLEKLQALNGKKWREP